MKKALLISYRFPPYGGGGVQRPLKFAKYLRDFGWEPVVQTARNPYWPISDETLLGQVPPGARVYRTPTFEFERLEQRVAAVRRGRRRGASVGQTEQDGAKPRAERKSLVKAVRSSVHRRLLIPDPQIAWLPGAFLHGLRIGRREDVQVVYTTSPPNSIQLLGRLVAAALRKPWVADFRDPWTDGVHRRQFYENNRARAALERAAERSVISRADRVIVTAEPLRARFLRKYPFLYPDKVAVLTNGFDPTDFPGEDPGHRLLEPGRFHLTGTGNIEALFDARPLLRAIAELTAEDEEIGNDLLVNLVGARKGKYDDDLQRLGLTDRVRYPGWVSHSESLRFVQESDVLLMCASTQPSGRGEKYPVKGFEYLYLRKPVLCLSVPGIVTDLLAESGLGTVVDPDDVVGIKTALRTFYAEREKPLRCDTAFIDRFDRRRLTGRLAAIFDELAGTE